MTNFKDGENMELDTLSDKELVELKDKYSDQESMYENMQMGLKILLNGGYGALANKHFLYYEVENAEAITLTGQLVNRWTCEYVDNLLKEVFDCDETMWVYSDTDSVGEDSIVNVDGSSIKISDLFDDVVSKGGNYIKNDIFNQKWVVKPNTSIKTPSVSKGGEINDSSIKYLMKHKVKKKMYRLDVGGESVDVTEDHSLMVKRNGRIIPSKVEDIMEGDKIIKLDYSDTSTNLNEHENFKITDLGEIEETVYDIEVENDHNFFANNILVHNSGYFSIGPFVDTLGPMPLDEKIDLCDRFSEEIVSPKIKERCQELSDYLNSYEQRMFWEREAIASKAAWIGKKKYVMSVQDDEGTRYTSEPKYKMMGMESKKSSTPEWARDFLKEAYITALTKDEKTLQNMLDKIRSEFNNLSINDIAVPRGVNGIDKYYDEVNLCKSGTPRHVRGVLVHNMLVDKLGLRKVPKIVSGSKIKFVELKMPNPTSQPVVAFDTYMPPEFGLEDYVDYDTIYEKSFMSPLRIFLNAIDWKEEEQIDLFDL